MRFFLQIIRNHISFVIQAMLFSLKVTKQRRKEIFPIIIIINFFLIIDCSHKTKNSHKNKNFLKIKNSNHKKFRKSTFTSSKKLKKIKNNTFLSKCNKIKNKLLNPFYFNPNNILKKLFWTSLCLINPVNSGNYLNNFSEYGYDLGNKIIETNDSKIYIGGASSLNSKDVYPTIYNIDQDGSIDKINLLLQDQTLKKNQYNYNNYGFISDFIEDDLNGNILTLSNLLRNEESNIILSGYNKKNNKFIWSDSYSFQNEFIIGNPLLKKQNSREVLIGGSKYNSIFNSQDIFLLTINLNQRKLIYNKSKFLFSDKYKIKLNSMIFQNPNLLLIGEFENDGIKELLFAFLDKNYDKIWAKSSTNNGTIEINSIYNNNNSVLICGSWYNNITNKKEIIFLELAFNGKVYWINSIENIGDSSCYSINRNEENIFLGISAINSINQFSQAGIININSNGTFIWGGLIKHKKGNGKISSIFLSNNKKDLLLTGNLENNNKSELINGKINIATKSNDCNIEFFKPKIKDVKEYFNFRDANISTGSISYFETNNFFKMSSYIPKLNSHCIIENETFKNNINNNETTKNKKKNIFFNWITIVTIFCTLLVLICILICFKKIYKIKNNISYRRNSYGTISKLNNYSNSQIDTIYSYKSNSLSHESSSIKRKVTLPGNLKLPISNPSLSIITKLTKVKKIFYPNTTNNKVEEKYPECLTNIMDKKRFKIILNENNNSKIELTKIKFKNKLHNEGSYSEPEKQRRGSGSFSLLDITKLTPMQKYKHNIKNSCSFYFDDDISTKEECPLSDDDSSIEKESISHHKKYLHYEQSDNETLNDEKSTKKDIIYKNLDLFSIDNI